jgi:hypothetical protein
VRSFKLCCSAQTIIVTYFYCVVFSRKCTTVNTHTPYFQLWPVGLQNIFPLCAMEYTIFEQTVIQNKTQVLFSPQLLSETFLILNYNKRTFLFMESTRYSYQILLKPEFSWHILEKFSDVRFHENPSIGSPIFPYGIADVLTERQIRMTRLIVASTILRKLLKCLLKFL